MNDDSIPADCEILKRCSNKIVIKTADGEVQTIWKHGKPQTALGDYGTETSSWERHHHGYGPTGWNRDLHG